MQIDNLFISYLRINQTETVKNWEKKFLKLYLIFFYTISINVIISFHEILIIFKKKYAWLKINLYIFDFYLIFLGLKLTVHVQVRHASGLKVAPFWRIFPSNSQLSHNGQHAPWVGYVQGVAQGCLTHSTLSPWRNYRGVQKVRMTNTSKDCVMYNFSIKSRKIRKDFFFITRILKFCTFHS